MNELTLLDNFRIHNFLRCLEKDNEYSNLFRINDYLDKKLLIEELQTIKNYLVSEDCIIEKISAFYGEKYHLFLRVEKENVEGAIDYFYVLTRGETIILLALDNDDNITSIYDSNSPENNVEIFKSSSVLTYNENEDENELKTALKNNIAFNNVMNNIRYFREIGYKKYLSLLEHYCDDEDYLKTLAPIRKRFLFKTLADGSSTLFYDFITGKAIKEDFVTGIQRNDLLTYRIKNLENVEDENNFLLIRNKNNIIVGDGIIEGHSGLVQEAPNLMKLPKELRIKYKEFKKELKKLIDELALLDPSNKKVLGKWVTNSYIPFQMKVVRYLTSLSVGATTGVSAGIVTGSFSFGLFLGLLYFTINNLISKGIQHVTYKYIVRYWLKIKNKMLWDPLYKSIKDDFGEVPIIVENIKEYINGKYEGIAKHFDIEVKEGELVGEAYMFSPDEESDELVTIEYAESYIENIMVGLEEVFGESYIVEKDITDNEIIHDLIQNEVIYGEGALGDFKHQLRKIKRTTTKLPKKVFTQLKKFKTKAEHLISNYRRNKRDNLKEKLINDEVIPFLDELLEWFVSLATGYGVFAVVTINPILAIIVGILTSTVLKYKMHDRTVKRKELAMKILKDEIDMLEENIQDARSENDRKARDTMKRMKKNLERKVERIRVENRLI
ncbi:MAG: hypothetical protein ACOCQD_01405 [archaeon]